MIIWILAILGYVIMAVLTTGIVTARERLGLIERNEVEVPNLEETFVKYGGYLTFVGFIWPITLTCYFFYFGWNYLLFRPTKALFRSGAWIAQELSNPKENV